jgi:hypothetical protein
MPHVAPWFRREDYARVREIMDDGDRAQPKGVVAPGKPQRLLTKASVITPLRTVNPPLGGVGLRKTSNDCGPIGEEFTKAALGCAPGPAFSDKPSITPVTVPGAVQEGPTWLQEKEKSKLSA